MQTASIWCLRCAQLNRLALVHLLTNAMAAFHVKCMVLPACHACLQVIH
jgi:hypothetical protein